MSKKDDDQAWAREYAELRRRIFAYGVTDGTPPAVYRDHTEDQQAAGGGVRINRKAHE